MLKRICGSDASPIELASSCFMISRAVQVAAELGIWARIAQRPYSVQALAQECRTSLAGTLAIIQALSALGLVQETDVGWRLVGGALEAPLDERTLAGMAGVYRDWLAMDKAVRTGQPQAQPAYRRDANSLQQYLISMHLSSLPTARWLAGHLPLQPRRILDVGGGLGTYALTICQDLPEASAVILDLEPVVRLGRSLVDGLPLAHQIRFLAADYLRTPLPSGHDLILMCNILHQEKPSDIRRLIRRAAAAITPGGWLVVHDILTDDNSAPPLPATLGALNSLLYHGARLYRRSELRTWLERAGFVVRTAERLTRAGAWVIMAQRES